VSRSIGKDAGGAHAVASDALGAFWGLWTAQTFNGEIHDFELSWQVRQAQCIWQDHANADRVLLATA